MKNEIDIGTIDSIKINQHVARTQTSRSPLPPSHLHYHRSRLEKTNNFFSFLSFPLSPSLQSASNGIGQRNGQNTNSGSVKLRNNKLNAWRLATGDWWTCHRATHPRRQNDKDAHRITPHIAQRTPCYSFLCRRISCPGWNSIFESSSRRFLFSSSSSFGPGICLLFWLQFSLFHLACIFDLFAKNGRPFNPHKRSPSAIFHQFFLHIFGAIHCRRRRRRRWCFGSIRKEEMVTST